MVAMMNGDGEELTPISDPTDFFRRQKRMRRRQLLKNNDKSNKERQQDGIEEEEGEVEEDEDVPREVGVLLNPFTGVRKLLQCTVYQVLTFR
jgi:hypothetical protein